MFQKVGALRRCIMTISSHDLIVWLTKLLLPADHATALLRVAPRRERGAVIRAVEHHDEGIIAEAHVATAESFSRDTGPMLFLERLIDDSTARRERLFHRFVGALLPPLV